MIMAIITVFCIIGNNLPTEKEIQCSYHYLQQSNCHLFSSNNASYHGCSKQMRFSRFYVDKLCPFISEYLEDFLLILHITTPPLLFLLMVSSWGFQDTRRSSILDNFPLKINPYLFAFKPPKIQGTLPGLF